ncbi:hypothetical protein CEP53_005408 [Fusarium sp. AF-6]|nr:hypothetical protein CEP53_005408 [Fusarium sp. AF-6]
MAEKEATRSQVLMSLAMLNPALRRMAKLCPPIGDAPNQLEVFSVVSRHLIPLVDVFNSIEEQLDSIAEETDQISKTYTVLNQAAVACCGRIQYLQQLFETVDRSQNKIADYRNAVETGQGKPLEIVMKEMLQDASSAAIPPLVSEEHIAALEDALQQIKKLPPSLGDEYQSSRVILHNHGAGNQFYHGGRGNMNHCSVTRPTVLALGYDAMRM